MREADIEKFVLWSLDHAGWYPDLWFPKVRREQVLNRSKFDDDLEVLENYGATRRDRTGDLLITNRDPKKNQ